MLASCILMHITRILFLGVRWIRYWCNYVWNFVFAPVRTLAKSLAMVMIIYGKLEISEIIDTW